MRESRFGSYEEHAYKTLQKYMPWGTMDGRCWEWLGNKNADGYAVMYEPGSGIGKGSGTATRVSRVLFRLTYGKYPPPGYTMDHVCHTVDLDCPGGRKCLHRLCVNPLHLEAVTNRENLRRQHARRVRCKYGHPRSGENLDKSRRCLTCKRRRGREAARRRRERQRDEKSRA